MFERKWDVSHCVTVHHQQPKEIKENLDFLEGYDNVVFALTVTRQAAGRRRHQRTCSHQAS